MRELYKRCLIVFLTCCIQAYVGPLTQPPCDRSRRVFTDSWGIITDGPPGSNYTQDSHCEWLIKANNSEQFITLKFQSMGTECSYDYVYVYDGDSFNSPLLGSFSGKTEPQEITATSGYMLILLYSDTNYVLEGFRAEYTISNCSRNCSNHGFCLEHSCICEVDWGGRDCSFKLCQENCGYPERGVCSQGKCICTPNYSGLSCTMYKYDNTGNKWHWIFSGGISPRAAHTAIYKEGTNSLYVFGGYDLNNVLGDLMIFRFNSTRWEDEDGIVVDGVASQSGQLDMRDLKAVFDNVEKWGLRKKTFLQHALFSLADNKTLGIRSNHDKQKRASRVHRDAETTEDKSSNTSSTRPSPRYAHAASEYPGGLVIFGGKLDDGSLSNDLWLYEVKTGIWSQRAVLSKIHPPPLARHTITLVPDGSLYVIGGSVSSGQFSSKVFRIKLTTVGGDENWEEINPRGGKELDVRVVAHTSVYSSGSLLVYGGIVASVARFSKLSDRIFAFHLASRHWAEIHYPRAQLRDTYVPRERAFHTATVVGIYMVVFGGYTHRHNKEEICYDNQLYLYHLGCHTWVNHDILGPIDTASRYPKRQGVFAHAAALMNGNTLLLVGGYHGNVNSDLLAFTLPPTLASRQGEKYEPEQMCNRHRGLLECTVDPECGWCPSDEVCYGRTLGANCTTNLQTTRCPGICPGLTHCHACLLHGNNLPSSSPASVAHKLNLGQCNWCVHNARCHPKNDNFGVCGLREDTPSQVPGWWGEKGVEVTDPAQCSVVDRRPGLTFIKYKHPANWSHPDYVSIINATTVDFNIGGGLTKTEQSLGGVIVAKLKGFLRPPLAWSNAKEHLRMCISHSSAVLKLSHDGGYLETVGNLTAEQTQCKVAYWPNGKPATLFPGRYLVDFESKKSIISGPFATHQHSKMELQHNKTLENPKVFTFEYLEPYEGKQLCPSYSNCLACLTDSKCGWCPLTHKCLTRNSNETEVCRSNTDWHYFTLIPFDCDNCSNYISCADCVNSGLCEWWSDDARCARKGRSLSAVTVVEECPVPCHRRANCSQCLDGNGRCVWCQATQECFSFAVYTSQYQFGICREWLDLGYQSSGSHSGQRNTADICNSCSRHANCSTCLKTLGCGWCYDTENATLGVCTAGYFSQPSVTTCSGELNTKHNTSLAPNEAAWSYAQCPDVDECGLGMHDCHSKAECTNTHGSYVCHCKKGYIGDGKHSCIKTCDEKCIHGYCNANYSCECDLGWTGRDCSRNCGCHNHSTCTKGINICDRCQNRTTGEFCQLCKSGSYGNATSEVGCHKCNCNEHGNIDLGVCDSKTAVCFCQDNTEGATCDKCKKGYYGDPRRGGTCYYQCMPRGMVNSKETQGLGSRLAEMSVWEARQGTPPSRECLWIVTPNNLHNSTDSPSIIQLTLDADINVACTQNSVFVYDGLPAFISAMGNHQSHVLGVFCSQDTRYPITVQAKTGILTVHYKQGQIEEGFNATVSVLSCPDHCPYGHFCQNGLCMCPEGATGPRCTDIICPNNCNVNFKRGTCDKGYGRCLCSPGWGGDDCSVSLNQNQLVFTELFNSDHISESYDHLRKMLPRFGHSLLSDRRGFLWLFGGYSLSHGPLNDIRLFDTKNNSWMQVTVDSTNDANMPQGRYFHAATISQVRGEIFIHGGLTGEPGDTTTNATLSDFWKFSLKNQRWIDIEGEGPPPLAGHTLTHRSDDDSESLVLIGGFSPELGFLDTVWEFSLESNKWQIMRTSGNIPIGVYGHSTVYHSPTQSFYLFGGYLYGVNTTYISDKLYSLHYSSRTWTVLPIFSQFNPPQLKLPRARFLHAAVTTDDYMLVFGGRSEPHVVSDSLMAYIYSCNHWIKLISKDAEVVGTGPPDMYAHAMTLDPEAASGGEVILYVMGGFTGGTSSNVTRINMPSDLCSLWSGKEKCRSFLGCSYCSVTGPNGNASFCYLNNASRHPNLDPCQNFTGTLRTSNGVMCNSQWVSARGCNQFTSCTDCLARWPNSWQEPQVCKWCGNCGPGKCISAGNTSDCLRDGKCGQIPWEINSVRYCPELQCSASDCDKCLTRGHCAWTRQVLKTPEEGMTLAAEPVYDWNCVGQGINDRTSYKLKSTPNCPSRCSHHKDCFSCLISQGGEGGWHECRWSTRLSQCISPSYQPLYCAGGVCGLVVAGNFSQCPLPCSSFMQCSTCLGQTHCGWCSINSFDSTGQGVCTEGSLDHPGLGTEPASCQNLLTGIKGGMAGDGNSTWHYLQCPPENECVNDHHSCDPRSETCIDLPQGYQCICGTGYRAERGDECVPVCSQGCVHGACVSPDVCKCDFGYVGANCSMECHCNGHSDCAGPDQLDVCLECRNNTQGPQCQRCRPLFVGDPTHNGECVPCVDYCNGHTWICINDSITDFMFTIDNSREEIEKFLVEGPTTRARCVGCANKTTGDKCEDCLVGNFRGSEYHTVGCRPCQCNGHGDKCNAVTGESCNCENNTESETNCQSVKGGVGQQCWAVQCSKCKDSYMGTPTGGHQCYKQMSVDLKYCLDTKLIEDCKHKPRPLNPGQTVFFAVQPRFMNVDIRVTVDVTQGNLKLFLSPRDDTFIVEVNSTTGAHSIEMDPRYRVREDGTGLIELETGVNSTSSSSLWHSKQHFSIQQLNARGLRTYVTVGRSNTLLVVHNLTDRLVITLPQDKHDLGSTRFYVALVATSQPTYGTVCFRQDQLHIDLFVFFSVFFSCFFLFLAGCVVAWKAKQAADARRARRRHVVEMLHMAKRPFASITVLLSGDAVIAPLSPARGPAEARRPRARATPGSLTVRPVAIEPTDDGVAAVSTVFVRLPGGRDAPVRLALGSTLVLLSRVYPTNSRAFLRRRSSHS